MIKHLTQRFILLCAISMMGVLQLGVAHNSYAQTTGNGCGPTGVELEIFPAYCGNNNGYFRVVGVTGGTGPYMYARNGTPFQNFNTFGNLLPGEYSITVRDANGCTYTEPVTIRDSRPTDFTATATAATCSSSNAQITVTDIVGGASPFQYSKDGGTTFQSSNVLTGLAAGTHTIVVKDRLECSVVKEVTVASESVQIQVTVTPQTKAIGQDKTGSATVSAVSGGVAPYTYQLDGGSFTAEPALTNLGAGTHTLVVKDSFGCTAEVSFVIESITEIDVPEGFTPNGDGTNDLWAIKNLSILFPNCKVTVYNRWGSLVFESKGYTTPWDGTHKGKMLPAGTYYSIIEFGDATPAIKKSLTIMR